MAPRQPLPHSPQFTSTDDYITSLLTFSRNPLFQILCGGVHILDFFTRDSLDSTQAKDLYHTILPAEWISYFSTKPLDDILELILRAELVGIDKDCPESLTSFITDVRAHSLRREFERKQRARKTARKSMGAGRKDGEEWALNAGMKPKKIHEVCYLYHSQITVMDITFLFCACSYRLTEAPSFHRLRTFPNSSMT